MTSLHQPDLSTLAGQARHYASVRARIENVKPVVREIAVPVRLCPAPLPSADEFSRAQGRDWLLLDDLTLPVLLPWRVIVVVVARKHGLTEREIIGHQRARPICVARQEVYYRISKETKMSLTQIGRKIGARDHTTVLHGIRAHAKRLAQQQAAQ